MQTKPHSKFSKFYFPGMISLICLPFLCIGYLIHENAFQKIGIIDVNWFNTQSLNEFTKFSHKAVNINNYRKFSDVAFTGSKAHDAYEEQKLEVIIKQLATKGDTINGIRVMFGKHALYNNVVTVIDKGYQYEGRNIGFMPYNDEILIWCRPPAKNEIPCCSLANDVIYAKPKVTFWDELNNAFSSGIDYFKLLIPFWPCLIILFVMGWLSISGKNRLYIHRKEKVFN